jgi:hypothetical protein
MVINLEISAVSGPTDEQQPPFQWSTSNLEVLNISDNRIYLTLDQLI